MRGSRVGFILALVVLAVSALPAPAQTPPPATPLLFRTVTRCRLLDTQVSGGAVQAGEARELGVVGQCGVPAAARAAYLNVTAVAPTVAGTLQAWGDASAPPATPVVSFAAGATVTGGALANLQVGSAFVRLEADGGAAHVVVDVLGYFEETAGDHYYGIVPCRLLDTQSGASGPLLDGQVRTVVASGNCQIPSGTHALAAVVTVREASGAGWLAAYPGGTEPPSSGTISYGAASVRASGTLIPLNAGSFAMLAAVAGGGSVHVSIDVMGYYE